MDGTIWLESLCQLYSYTADEDTQAEIFKTFCFCIIAMNITQ